MHELETEASFDSAHFLTDYQGACENLHGHRWRVVVRIGSERLESEGTEKDMVMDFAAFKAAVRAEVERLDHTFLVENGSLSNETLACLEAEGFSLTVLPFRTTAENLARHLFDTLAEQGLPVTSVEVDETPNNRAIYRPA